MRKWDDFLLAPNPPYFHLRDHELIFFVILGGKKSIKHILLMSKIQHRFVQIFLYFRFPYKKNLKKRVFLWENSAFVRCDSYSLLSTHFILIEFICNTSRYAYFDDSEEFDNDETLTLIKLSPLPSKDARSQSEVRSTLGGNEASNGGDLEEDKTE